jgi:exonuclease-1
MGINGGAKLWAPLKTTGVHVKDVKEQIKNKIVGGIDGNAIACVDAGVLMHKGKLCDGGGTGIVRDGDFGGVAGYVTRQVKKIEKQGVEVILVFDGARIESKCDVEKKRQHSRNEAKAKGDEAYNSSSYQAAEQLYRKAVDVSPDMARAVMDKCGREGIRFLVAPYEADAQLGDLCRRGVAHFCISVDSDLPLFGCQFVLSMMGKSDDMEGDLTDLSRLEEEGSEYSGFDEDMLLNAAILSGCDYQKNIGGLGVVTAVKLVRKHRGTEGLLSFL